MSIVVCWCFTAFLLHSLGESPSSSASDIDNLNNLAVVDKVTMTRGSNTHVANNQVISAQNRPNIVRLLDFVSFNFLTSLMFHLEILSGCLDPGVPQNYCWGFSGLMIQRNSRKLVLYWTTR